MMNLSNNAAEDFSASGDHSSRSVDRPPRQRQTTPDSVVGMCIVGEEEGDSSSNSNADEDIKTVSISSTPSPSSWGQQQQQQNDLASPNLLNILTVESKEQYQVKPNYLHSSVLMQNLPPPPDSKDQGVSERCRRRTCEWMYDICDYFKLNREVVGIALFYVDRYFTITFEGSDSDSDSQQKVPVTRRQFQLVALTGLYIAVKLHGESRQENPTYRPTTTSLERSDSTSSCSSQQQQWNRLKFSLSVCSSISRNQFTTAEIEECERKVFGTLDWHLNPIISSGNIIDLLLIHLPTMDGGDDSIALFVYDCAKYLAELSISVPALCLVYKPSIVAYSAILYAMDTLITTKSSSSSDVCFTTHDRQEYERLVCQVSSQHFHREKENVSSAMKILQKICPNLSELFTPPLVAPKSPTSVRASITLS